MNPTYFGIVVPVLNQARYVGEALASLFSQVGENHLWVHVQDGGSSDGTIQVVKAWQERSVSFPRVTMTYDSRRDSGVPQALNRGFAVVEGEFLSWLGADDILFPWALNLVATTREAFPQFHWVTGTVAHLGEAGVPLSLNGLHGFSSIPTGFSRFNLSRGKNRGGLQPLIQQEGTFWTRVAFEKAGGTLSEGESLAFDFDLWLRLSQNYNLMQVGVPLAAFRKRPNQLSSKFASDYARQAKSLARRAVMRTRGRWPIVRSLDDVVHYISYVRMSDGRLRLVRKFSSWGPARVFTALKRRLVGAFCH